MQQRFDKAVSEVERYFEDARPPMEGRRSGSASSDAAVDWAMFPGPPALRRRGRKALQYEPRARGRRGRPLTIRRSPTRYKPLQLPTRQRSRDAGLIGLAGFLGFLGALGWVYARAACSGHATRNALGLGRISMSLAACMIVLG
ncbi:MAG: hypothetical protein U5K43_03125 [Halofilum sp. (in: g-proteobacteria)]|nr:hypothetical protein [Halofilum sp. (in: g-proteobacteria)]